MPVYFAYGANMDVAAMALRCPASTPLGPARLMNHRFHIMGSGFASVRPVAGAVVYGLLWDLAFADIPSLDRFEEVGRGLYRKIVQPVIKPVGTARALIYVGKAADNGLPRPGYLDGIIAGARAVPLPPSYVRTLVALLGPATASEPRGTPAVRPRFATPFDR